MKNFHLNGLLSVMLALTSAVPCRGAEQESTAERDTRMGWWREARFGMFVHWGLYSGLAGTWDGKAVGTKGGMEWIQQSVKADTDTYGSKALPLFMPKPGFAAEWMKLARQAGCKYVVFTTKHHEGFGLHASKAGDYNAGAKLNRDLVKEIVDAARAEGLKVGFYHSMIDWHHDQYEYAKAHGMPHPLAGKPYANGQRDHKKYISYLHAQVKELLTNYGKVDILWWDFSSAQFQGDEAWGATDLMKMARSLQPDIVMNNRLYSAHTVKANAGEATSHSLAKGDFTTPEQRIPGTGMPGVDWETCMTLNTTWGYSDHDHAWKSDATLIRNLIDIASKGGNYLLNIGPKGDGSLNPETIKAFTAIGDWMKINGEAIHGTQASPFAKLPFDGRCTRKAGTLYFHVFDWPKDGKLVLPVSKPVKKAYLLTMPQESLELTVEESGGVVVTVPAAPPDAIASVVVVETEGK